MKAQRLVLPAKSLLVAAKILLASSNAGKLAEFRALLKVSAFSPELELFPNFELIPAF